MSFRKLILWSLMVSGSLSTAAAQVPAGSDSPPGITIRKYKWEQVGPGPSVDQSWKAESDSASIGGSSDESSSVTTSGRPLFVYTVELQNGGSKAIRAIRWEYIIFDSKSSTELGNHAFENFEPLGLNKSKLLRARSRLSPTKVVPIQVSDKATMTEKVVLRCVLYQDGSLWRHRDTTAPECEAVRQRAAN